MGRQQRKPKAPKGSSHHHEGWLEHLSHLGLVHGGMHLPFAKIFLALTFIVAAGLSAMFFIDLVNHWEDRRVEARANGQADAAEAARFMDSQLEEIISVARHVADFDLTEGRYLPEPHSTFDLGDPDDDPNEPRNPFEERLHFLLDNNTGFWGVGACFEEPADPDRVEQWRALTEDARLRAIANGLSPHETGQGTGLYCPYYTRPGGVVTFTPVTYDYADSGYFLPGAENPRGIWYQRPRDGGAQWNPPYFGTTSRRMVAEYGIPFFDSPAARDDYVVSLDAGAPSARESTPAGVVFVNFTLDQISRNVSWLNLGGRGYGFLVDASGTYVAHPDEAYYSDPERQRTGSRQLSLSELGNPSYAGERAGELDQAALRKLDARRLDCSRAGATAGAEDGEEFVASGSGYIDYKDDLTGRDSWIFYEPVPSACWTLGSVVVKGEVLGRDSRAKHLLMWISATLIVAVFALVALTLRVVRGYNWLSWSVVITFAVLCAAGVLWVWWLARTAPQVEAGLNGDGQTLSEIVDDYVRRVRLDEHLPEVTQVYAGVSLSSVDDAGDGDLTLSGIAWQRYTEDEPPVDGADAEGFEPGFVFSDNPADTTFEALYDVRNGKTRILGWSFRTVVSSPSNIEQFPFDRGEVVLRLAPRDIDEPVILIPDLSEYDLTAPAARPGLGDEFSLPGWSVERSYYGYEPNPRDSNIGIPDFSVREDEPQLRYTILFARNSVNPFISRMLPVAVVSILVFCLFLIVYSTRLSPEDFPLGTGVTSLSFLSALMFVLILGHNSLRSALGTSGIIYLEYFYFIMYFAVLAVAMRIISMIFGYGVGWTYYRREFTLARIYWPTVALAALVATWLAFY